MTASSESSETLPHHPSQTSLNCDIVLDIQVYDQMSIIQTELEKLILRCAARGHYCILHCMAACICRYDTNYRIGPRHEPSRIPNDDLMLKRVVENSAFPRLVVQFEVLSWQFQFTPTNEPIFFHVAWSRQRWRMSVRGGVSQQHMNGPSNMFTSSLP